MATLTQMLTAFGWRSGNRQAVLDFQRGWNLGTALVVDGIAGPKTKAALALSYARHVRGVPDCSAHFSFREFQCKCGGRYANCRRVWIVRKQVQNMERYRAKAGRSIQIVSGNRCPGWNKVVGGASQSRHLTGEACDFGKVFSHGTVESWKIFGGIGYGAVSGEVCHGDARPGFVSWRYNGT